MLAHAAKCPERDAPWSGRGRSRKKEKERTTSDAESITEVVSWME